MKITTILFLVALSFFSNEILAQTSEKDNSVTKQDTLSAIGVITKQPMATKKGESPYLEDYYFKTENQSYFINYRVSDISTDSLDKHLNHKVKITFLLKHGNWDAKDNEAKQSRGGDYISILTLKLN